MSDEPEYLLLIKRKNIDATWQIAPYKLDRNGTGLMRLLALLRRAWTVEFEWKVVKA